MSPYGSLPANAFWRTGVADHNPFEIGGLWTPRFAISRMDRISTFGSCFAQHIARSLRERGYFWLNTEPGPGRVDPRLSEKYNYNIFTCRTGNIYTASLLLQWTRWALGAAEVPDEVWAFKRRYYDPFRPAVEPNGFASPEEVRRLRQRTISAFRDAIMDSTVLVFTLGLTESWWNEAGRYEYPMCPGTAAGTFDPAQHTFLNQGFPFVRDSLEEALRLMRGANDKLRVLLTVSPVPLTATNSGRHVLVATMASKSILRAVAEDMTARHAHVDYFPSYEIISSPVFRGAFFEANQRSVSQFGVGQVMGRFFSAIEGAAYKPLAAGSAPRSEGDAGDEPDGVVCEEELLGAFGPASGGE